MRRVSEEPHSAATRAASCTLTLFAALNYLEGKLITRLAARHRHQEWLAFLKLIDQQSPADVAIHIIADNYATHKHPEVKKWLGRYPRHRFWITATEQPSS